jgi:hypothetical protein
MIATPRIQRKYDPRLQAIVKSTGSIDVALEHGTHEYSAHLLQDALAQRFSCKQNPVSSIQEWILTELVEMAKFLVPSLLL